MDPRGAVAALGPLVGLADVLGELGVNQLPGRGAVGAVGVVGGTGDLQQLTGPLDVALLCLLRLDERIQVHRVSFAKKAVARLRISTSSRSRRFSRRNADTSCRSVLVNPPSRRLPASRSACWPNATISALNSGWNVRRARGFLRSMVSMMDILYGAAPLMVDVRQN